VAGQRFAEACDMAYPGCFDISTRNITILTMDDIVRITHAHGLLRKISTMHPLTKRDKTVYHKRVVEMDHGFDGRLDPRIPARYMVPTQLRRGGGDIWLASCPIERGGILEIPYTWPREGSWWSSKAQEWQASPKIVCNIASCHVTFLARESPRALQKKSPSLSVG
jgi:hypothetical protein